MYGRQEISTRTGTRRQAVNEKNEQRTFVLPKETGKPNRPLALRWDTCHWPWEFLTPLNWALRVWLKRDNDDQDQEYVRVIEGGGVRDMLAAEKMKVVLLEEMSRIPQRSVVCGSL